MRMAGISCSFFLFDGLAYHLTLEFRLAKLLKHVLNEFCNSVFFFYFSLRFFFGLSLQRLHCPVTKPGRFYRVCETPPCLGDLGEDVKLVSA